VLRCKMAIIVSALQLDRKTEIHIHALLVSMLLLVLVPALVFSEPEGASTLDNLFARLT